MTKTTPGKNASTALQQAGVKDRSLRTATLSLEEIQNPAIIRLHSLQEQPFQGNVPFKLPGGTGTCGGDDPVSLCLRPREWLLVSETIPAQTILQRLWHSIDPGQTSALDSSDGLAQFRLSGKGAPWLLSKLSCLDFLDGKNHGRHCARTKMGHIAVIVFYHQPPDPAWRDQFVFDLILDRSFAKYLWLLLTESADHADELTTMHGDTT